VADRVRVCRRDELEPGTARRVEVAGRPVAIVAIGDEVFAIGDTCSHEEASLAEGELWPEECEIECPKHGSTFDLRTGEPQTLPATAPVPVLRASVDGDDVVVEVPEGWVAGAGRGDVVASAEGGHGG
jgi:3-phenylpropionate/trans-cinnamate dioxygenase ferredoxin subunit